MLLCCVIASFDIIFRSASLLLFVVSRHFIHFLSWFLSFRQLLFGCLVSFFHLLLPGFVPQFVPILVYLTSQMYYIQFPSIVFVPLITYPDLHLVATSALVNLDYVIC
ncbi:hypothetical protein FRC03_002316, partial [Tulasnella sp. 419]